MERRGFIEFLAGGASGILVGYYVGAKELLGIQRKPPISTTSTAQRATTTTTTVSTPTATRTESPTQTESLAFVDTFQSGSYRDNWSIVWYDGNAVAGSDGIDSTNNWAVRQHPITESLALNVKGKGDAHAIATDKKVIDLSQDLRFEYSFTPDKNGIGARVTALEYDQNGSPDNRITEETPRAPFGAAERGNQFKFLDFQKTLDSSRFSPNQVNTIQVEWKDGIVRGFHNDELIAEGSASMSGVSIHEEKDQRLQIQANGAYGGSISFWTDSIKLQYL